MNDQGLDKLFRDRLEGLEEHPPKAAWDRLDNQLQGRKRKAWWLLARVAAVLIIIACSVIVFNKGYLSNVQDPQLSEINDDKPVQSQEEVSENINDANENLVAENKTSSTESNKEKTDEASQNRASETRQSEVTPQQPSKASAPIVLIDVSRKSRYASNEH